MKYSILVVDDQKIDVKTIFACLKKNNFNPIVVSSAFQALKRLEKGDIDLVLLDFFMPDMNGYEFCAKLRLESDIFFLPIIMLTADEVRKDRIKALELGIDDYITKPYNSEELVARVQAVFRRTKFSEIKEPQVPIGAEEKKLLEFLELLIGKDIDRLEPKYSLATKSGYVYKYA